MSGVTQERSGWRDEEISRRHRLWGVSCAAVDAVIDRDAFNRELAQEKEDAAELKALRTTVLQDMERAGIITLKEEEPAS